MAMEALAVALNKQSAQNTRSLVFSLTADQLEHQAWILIEELSKHCTKEVLNEAPSFFSACEDCLIYVADRANSKEMLIVLMEQLKEEDEKVKLLLFVCGKLLKKLPTNRQHTLELILTSFFGHLHSLPQPSGNCLSEEKLVIESSDAVSRLHDLCQAFTLFISPLFKEVKPFFTHHHKPKAQEDVQRVILRNSVLKVLALLSFCYLGSDERSSPAICLSVAIDCMQLLVSIYPDLMQFIRWHDADIKNMSADEMEEYEDIRHWHHPPESIATVFFLVFCEDVMIESVPSPYCASYLFRRVLNSIQFCMYQSHNAVIEMGLKLLESMLKLFCEGDVGAEFMDLSELTITIQKVLNQAVMCQEESGRKRASRIIKTLSTVFCRYGRILFITYLLRSDIHPSVNALGTQLLKSEVDHVLSSNQHDSHALNQMNLNKLWPLVFKLENAERTDILDVHSRIMTSLNFARYLLIRDKSTNFTEFQNYTAQLKSSFLEPLKKGIDITRAHYKLEIKQLKSRKPVELEVNVNVGGKGVTNLSAHQSLEILESSLTSLDLMELVIGSVNQALL